MLVDRLREKGEYQRRFSPEPEGEMARVAKDVDPNSLSSRAEILPLWKTPAYQALMQLRNVAEDVVTHSTSLILHLLG